MSEDEENVLCQNKWGLVWKGYIIIKEVRNYLPKLHDSDEPHFLLSYPVLFSLSQNDACWISSRLSKHQLDIGYLILTFHQQEMGNPM